MTDTELKRIKAICEVANVADIGDLSDGFHTFNSLYYQRMILFAVLVHAYKDRAWKSYRHEDGELCFGGGWFIVGIDTPEGNYTYHYESKDFERFDCVELPRGKHWDGHTEDDVTRLLSLPTVSPDEVRGVGEWICDPISTVSPVEEWFCSICKQPAPMGYGKAYVKTRFCPNCGAKMEVSEDE